MTKRERAVAVAKDVLARLKNNKIMVTMDMYLKPGPEWTDEYEHKNAQKVINKIEGSCQVCALGACFLSYIRRFDGVMTDEVGPYNAENSIHKHLIKIFSRTQMDLIEAAFEGWDSQHPLVSGRFNKKDSHTLDTFIDENYFVSSPDRLRIIMKNIIANKGVFKS